MSMILMKGNAYILRDVKTGVNETTGEPWALVKVAESDNCENKSRRIFKCWGATVPEGLKAGDKAVLADFMGAGIRDEHIGAIYGEDKFKACGTFTGVTWTAYVEKPVAKEKAAKKA